MKKNNGLKRVIKVIDKNIIIPLTNFFMKIYEKIDKQGLGIDKLLSKKSSLVIISLIISLILFFVIDIKSILLTKSSADVIYNQKINAIYNEEAYVIEGLPEHVDITLIGRSSDLYLAKQLSTHDVTLDLKKLKPGTHKVSLKYKGAIDSIDYKLDPSIASITIYPKVSEVRTISMDVLNIDKLESKLSIESIKSEKEEVIIKGASHILKEVSSVKALLDINGIQNMEEGTHKVNDISLIAYDQKGFILDVEIVPSAISANVKIESYNKVVPIKLIPVGNLSFGKAIVDMISDIDVITIYGEKQTIDKINEFEVEVDVENISSNKTTKVSIKRPNGIRYINEKNINVDIKVGEESTREIVDIKIESRNLSSNLSTSMANKEDTEITVIIKGHEEVINKIKPEDITVYVDLSGYKPGNHEVEVLVVGKELKVQYISKTKKVNLVILEKR